jgi:DNA polymerase-3 subunit delta'
VVVIDAIDDCNPNAANALLKILEEPPSETLFLLVSHRPGGLLPTIRSRCQQLPFRPVGNAGVQRVLAETALDLSGPELATAVALAEGRPRRAFEAMAVSGAGFLSDLQNWLRDPLSAGHAAHLSIAESLGPGASDAAWLFARDMLVQWCANAAREAALTGDRARLASANALWDKAQAIFAETESLNLDARQSLTILLDTILVHLRLGASAPETA